MLSFWHPDTHAPILACNSLSTRPKSYPFIDGQSGWFHEKWFSSPSAIQSAWFSRNLAPPYCYALQHHWDESWKLRTSSARVSHQSRTLYFLSGFLLPYFYFYFLQPCSLYPLTFLSAIQFFVTAIHTLYRYASALFADVLMLWTLNLAPQWSTYGLTTELLSFTSHPWRLENCNLLLFELYCTWCAHLNVGPPRLLFKSSQRSALPSNFSGQYRQISIKYQR